MNAPAAGGRSCLQVKLACNSKYAALQKERESCIHVIQFSKTKEFQHHPLHDCSRHGLTLFITAPAVHPFCQLAFGTLCTLASHVQTDFNSLSHVPSQRGTQVLAQYLQIAAYTKYTTSDSFSGLCWQDVEPQCQTSTQAHEVATNKSHAG